MAKRLKYGNTNTFYIPGTRGALLVDTDYAGTLSRFYRAIKEAGIRVSDITFVLATHFHPDHMGLIPELTHLGVKLLLMDVQKDGVHYSDPIFLRDGIPFTPVDESEAIVISCEGSRKFLYDMGIRGEIVHTPSHSPDSVALILDDGDCFAGDLEPREYIEAYGENEPLKRDWENITSRGAKRIFFAHRPECLLE